MTRTRSDGLPLFPTTVVGSAPRRRDQSPTSAPPPWTMTQPGSARSTSTASEAACAWYSSSMGLVLIDSLKHPGEHGYMIACRPLVVVSWRLGLKVVKNSQMGV